MFNYHKSLRAELLKMLCVMPGVLNHSRVLVKMQITGLKSKPTVFVLVPLEPDPETRIQLQEVDLVGGPKNSSRGE